MTKLDWNTDSARIFENGIDRAAFYPANGGDGIAWAGMVGVDVHNTSDAIVPYFMDGIKYDHRAPLEAFSATIKAYTYPEEFESYDGTLDLDTVEFNQQQRRYFDLTYRTGVGVDGYKLHLVYNVMVEPTSVTYSHSQTSMFSWGISSKPIIVKRLRPISHLIIDSTKTNPALLRFVEDYIYGADWLPRMLSPDEIIRLFGLYRSGYGYGDYGHGLYGHGPGVIE